MARKGRPRKANAKRHPGGRVVHEPQLVKPSDWVQAQQAKYQTHYSSALGRAYAAGLLADNEDTALDRYQGGKRFARVYNRIIGGETYRCALDRSPVGGSTVTEVTEQDMRDKQWLFAAMDSIDVAGVRPWLDQLITRAHTDHGPRWLENLLTGGRDPADQMILKAAIKALDIVAPARKEVGILVQHWEDAA